MDVQRPPSEAPDERDDLDRLAQLLRFTGSVDTFLADLVGYARRETDHGCSITVGAAASRPYTVVSTDELTEQLDEQQYSDGQGPCLEALATGVPVFVTDMTEETRWASYPARAAELGVRSSMSYPLISGDSVIGALNMYAPTPLTPDAGMQARAAQLADRAAGALAAGLQISRERAEDANLREALTSRSIVDQAIGVLIAQQRCSVEEAFALLRKTSQARNIKLRDVAAQIVASAQRRQPGKPQGRY